MELVEFLAIEAGAKLSNRKLLELIKICKYADIRELSKEATKDDHQKIKDEYWELRKAGNSHNKSTVILANKYSKNAGYIGYIIYKR